MKSYIVFRRKRRHFPTGSEDIIYRSLFTLTLHWSGSRIWQCLVNVNSRVPLSVSSNSSLFHSSRQWLFIVTILYIPENISEIAWNNYSIKLVSFTPHNGRCNARRDVLDEFMKKYIKLPRRSIMLQNSLKALSLSFLFLSLDWRRLNVRLTWYWRQ